MVTQCFTSHEVAANLCFITVGQGIGPAVAEILRLFDGSRRTARIEGRYFIGFTIDPDECGYYFRPIWQRVGLIIGKLGNKIVGPGAVLSLVTLERRERDDLVRTHCPRAPLRSWCNRTAPFLRRNDFTARWVKQIQHVRSPPTVQLKHVYFLKMLRQTPHTEGFAIVAGIVQIDN